MKLIKKAYIITTTFLVIVIMGFILMPNTYASITRNTPFVTAKNGEFYIGDDPFRFVGTNNYYLNYKDKAMIDAVLDDSQAAGFNVIRMWGFLDGDSSSIVENKAWMQPEQGVFTAPSWAGHDFANGWDRMDYAISEAAKRDIRILLVFTNYWDDFGGIIEYVNWYNQKHGYTKSNPNYAQKHHFFTNEEIKGYYKEYVDYLLSRTNNYNGRKYIEDPTIFAWELMNEPRNPKLDGGAIEDVTNWANEMSTYIKDNHDDNHMIALGDEGSFDKRSDWDYEHQAQHLYDGSEGVDFEKVLALPNIDFGTYHLYPESWGINHSHMEWGTKFIKDHIRVGKDLGKPVILEEFGISANLGRNRELIYNEWMDTVYNEGGAGAMFWMYASIDTSENGTDGGYYPDYDGFRLAEIPGKYPELELLKTYAKLFSGADIDFNDKIYVLSPYTTTGFLQIEGDNYENQIFPISISVRTNRTVNKVEMFLDGDYYQTLIFNNQNNTYDGLFNMRHIYRGSDVDVDFIAYTNAGQINSDTIEVRRLMKFDYFIEKTFNFDIQYGGSDVQLGYYGAYNAEFHNTSWTDLNDGMIAISLDHNRDHFWSEVKLEVTNLSKELLIGSYNVSFDVYYQKDKLTEGVLKPTDEAYETAPGFRHYAALDPGWAKIGLNENNIKHFELEEVEINGIIYLKQRILIGYNANVNQSKLVIGFVTNHLLYDEVIYFDNLSFYNRTLSNEALADDDYIDWREEQERIQKEKEQQQLMLTIGSITITIAALVSVAGYVVIKKRKNTV